MPLFLNTIFEQESINLNDVRLLRHQDGSAERGRSPYFLWQQNHNGFMRYQSVQSFKDRATLKPAKFWASFVVTPSHETLFVGLYQSRYNGVAKSDLKCPHKEGFDAADSVDVYNLSLDKKLSDFNGRMVVEWGKGKRVWIQRANLRNKQILEIAAKTKEEGFPGFAKFLSPLNKINSLPHGWIEILKASKGIYLLTCVKEGVHYIGSASAEDGGFWGRWMQHAKKGGDAVAFKNRSSVYDVSILEVAGSLASLDQIRGMEEIWKIKLNSRIIGLNRN